MTNRKHAQIRFFFLFGGHTSENTTGLHSIISIAPAHTQLRTLYIIQ